MDEEMEEATEGDPEIDLDYEFDAPRYFDLSRAESLSETWEAELWFHTAGTYPPSPLIANINTGQDAQVENINTLSKLEEVKYAIPISDDFENHKGWTIHSCITQNIPKGDTNVKGPFSRGSTLMKPTASQLAKQNRSRFFRLQKPLETRSEQRMEDRSDNASQPAKRQKLEGGYFCKVLGLEQQTDLIHKGPKKKNEPPDCNSRLPRLKITIPREPMLETAKRATAFRAERLRSKNAEQLQEGIRPTTSTFKARPLNRKILEAPSFPLPQKSIPRLPNFQEFKLKTNERANQHSSAASSSLEHCVNSDHVALMVDNPIPDSSIQGGVTCSRRLLCQLSGSSQLQNDDKKLEECGKMLLKFKARPLNKKIISSNGDIGVFRSTKQEVTKPKEFKFSMKKCQQSPLTEVFNKLSLASEGQQRTAFQTNVQQPLHVAHKGLKENMINPAQ